MRRSASSLAPQGGGQEVRLGEYTLERLPLAPEPASTQDRERDRVHHHHHHHHHRCHRRRDKKHKSLDRAISEEQPGSVDTPTDPSSGFLPREWTQERERDRGRSHERKHHSSSATDRKQRYYSCDRYGSREHCHSQSPGPSRSASPGDPHEANRLKPGGNSVKGSPVGAGTNTLCRGRRQLPQTPLTPRPSVAFKTANSSPVQFSAGRLSGTGAGPARLSRGQSEHDAILSGDAHRYPMPVTRICSDPNLGPLQRDPHLSEAEDFQDALSSYGSGRSPRTAASHPSSGGGSSPMLHAQSRSGVPNGYHFTLGVSAARGSNARVSSSYQEMEKDDWC